MIEWEGKLTFAARNSSMISSLERLNNRFFSSSGSSDMVRFSSCSRTSEGSET